MYLATLRKHPQANSNQLMIIVYKIYCLIKSRSMTCASMSELTMSSLVDTMIRDNLDTNVIAHDRNLIIMIPHDFLHAMLCIMDFINSIKDLYQFNV